MEIKRIYEVPSRTDEERRVWYRTLSDMHFATAKVGWAVGSAQILRTRDSGRTWVNQFKEAEGCCYLNPHRVFAVNSKVCWVIAISSASDIRCCCTQDGGETWEGRGFDPEVYPNDIFFIDSKRGWLISDNGSLPASQSRIHCTKNAGVRWETHLLPMDGKAATVRFLDASKGWIVEHFMNQDQTKTLTNLHSSRDGGHNWSNVTRFDRAIYHLLVLDENRMFVTGEAGFVAKTVDGGSIWQRKKTRSRANVNAVSFYNSKLGMALCDFGGFFLTQDGGETWEKINKLSDTSNLLRANFTSQTQGVLASESSIHLFDLSC